MKKIACEMCGSNELIKNDGMFECQHCGCKYTIEEAKKLMIEGNVDVSGSTVKVDNSAFVEKYLKNARRAMQKEDWEETEKYYNMVEQNDPSNIESIFYSSYAKAKIALIDSNIYKRQAAFNSLQKCVSIIDDNFDVKDADQNVEIIRSISNDLIGMAGSNYVYNVSNVNTAIGNIPITDKSKTIEMFINLQDEFCNTLFNIINKYEDKQKTGYLFEIIVKHYTCIINNCGCSNDKSWKQKLYDTHVLWNQYFPRHVVPATAQPTPSFFDNIKNLPLEGKIIFGFIAFVVFFLVGFFVIYLLDMYFFMF